MRLIGILHRSLLLRALLDAHLMVNVVYGTLCFASGVSIILNLKFAIRQK
jgi:hypothetical protein